MRNREIPTSANASRRAETPTTLHGRPVLRICPINPRTTEDDIRTTIEMFESLASDAAGSV